MKSIIQVDKYNDKNIFTDISFNVEEGTFNLLIGKNGSGKTTLINIILNSNDLTIHKNYKKLGYITEKLNFINKTPMEEFLFILNNLNYKKRESEKIIYDMSDKLDIGRILNKTFDTLSQTEKILISIASILIYSPDLIVLDNSLDYLDNKTRKKIINILKQYTVLMVSHNPEDILISDKVFILENGSIIQTTKEELYNNERLLLNNNYKLPFMIDLSKKLISYGLIENITISKKEMVNEIWN